jgi:hypothetical protein
LQLVPSQGCEQLESDQVVLPASDASKKKTNDLFVFGVSERFLRDEGTSSEYQTQGRVDRVVEKWTQFGWMKKI